MMYKAVVKAVILYGSEIWVVKESIMTVLYGFHHKVARRIMGMTARRGNSMEWEWASVDAALEVTGIWTIREYVRMRKAKITEYVAGRKFYELCTGTEKM